MKKKIRIIALLLFLALFMGCTSRESEYNVRLNFKLDEIESVIVGRTGGYDSVEVKGERLERLIETLNSFKLKALREELGKGTKYGIGIYKKDGESIVIRIVFGDMIIGTTYYDILNFDEEALLDAYRIVPIGKRGHPSKNFMWY
ncbi:hypothetical protein [Guggenheimella bovis]